MSALSNKKKWSLEHVNCNFCGDTEYRVLYKKPFLSPNPHFLKFEFPMVECINCGLRYVNPRLKFEEISFFYGDEYHANRNTSTHRDRYKEHMKLLPTLEVGKVLDIGCAKGDFLNHLLQERPGIIAYGLDAFSLGVNNPNIQFVRSGLKEASFSEESFDFITSWMVLEHVYDPKSYFMEISRILKPGGQFIFSVPNGDGIRNKYSYGEDIPRHVYAFTVKTISYIAGKTGLVLERSLNEDRSFDERSKRFFWFFFAKLLFVTWETLHFKRMNSIQFLGTKLGSFLDKILYPLFWEEKIGKGGSLNIILRKPNA